MLAFLALARAAVACDPASYAQGLVVNEVLVDPEGVAPGLQWIELFNQTGLDLNASGWRLEAGVATFDTISEFPQGTWLIDGEFLVIAQSALPFADLVAPGFVAGPGLADADALRLVDCYGDPVDTVVYGPANPDGWVDDSGAVATSLAPASASGQVLARVADGLDTDRAGDDFALVTSATPGSSNAAPPEGCGGPGSGLLVNEVADGWVELVHTGASPVLLAGWSIAVGVDGMVSAYTFGPGQVAAPGARFVVGDDPAAAYPGVVSLAGATAVRLVDCDGFGSDTVVFGDNAMGWLGDDGVAAVGVAPAFASPTALGRFPDGVDSDDASADFQAFDIPTPAAPNDFTAWDPGTVDTGTPPTEPATDETTPDTPATGSGTDDTAEVDDDDDDGCGCATGGVGGLPLGALAALALTGTRSRRRR